MSSASGSGSGSSSPFAWLGLLKWSLSYSDGTSNEPPAAMSPEDRAFLDNVMKEGIIDENERMTYILQQVTHAMEIWMAEKLATETRKEEKNESQAAAAAAAEQPDTDEILDLLQELRDIVEQIDYAHAFCAMGGLPFLLGCIAERKVIPTPIRGTCLGIIATLCQNNPPVQLQLLELGSLKVLCDLYYTEVDDDDDLNATIRTRIVQAASANVRSHARVEEVFCQLPQSVAWIEAGLQVQEPFALRQRTLFFLRALITSDTSSSYRVQQFQSCVTYVLQHYLDDSAPHELQEMTLALLNQILDRGFYVTCILEHQEQLLTLADQHLSTLRNSSGQDHEFEVERDEWERLVVNINRGGNPSEGEARVSQLAEESAGPVLMIEQSPLPLPQ